MTRAVLVVRHRGDEEKAVGAIDEIRRLGWTLVGVVEPERHLDALRLVVDGKADVVVTARPGYLPSVAFIADLRDVNGDGQRRPASPARTRTRMVARPARW